MMVDGAEEGQFRSPVDCFGALHALDTGVSREGDLYPRRRVARGVGEPRLQREG
jgi:hypothetical protein